jgi:hypothetical protein
MCKIFMTVVIHLFYILFLYRDPVDSCAFGAKIIDKNKRFVSKIFNFLNVVLVSLYVNDETSLTILATDSKTSSNT